MENNFYIVLPGQYKQEAILKSNFKGNFYDVISGIEVYSKPIETTIKFGTKFYDVLYFGDGINFVISNRFKKLLEKYNISGWNSYSVSIKNVNQEYFGMQITGRAGELVEPDERGFYKGLKFNPSSWDGSDFFSPEGTSYLFTTIRLKKLLIENNITNIEVINIHNIEAYSDGKKP